jgi:hypothetical protein
MASDGHIDNKEISMVKSLCKKSPMFENFNFQIEINELVVKINANIKEFIKDNFDIIKTRELTEKKSWQLLILLYKICCLDFFLCVSFHPKNQVHTLTYTPMPSIKASASNSPSPTFSKKNESK